MFPSKTISQTEEVLRILKVHENVIFHPDIPSERQKQAEVANDVFSIISEVYKSLLFELGVSADLPGYDRYKDFPNNFYHGEEQVL